ncbi:MAG: hypothetical protein QXS90_00605 [Candidatus Diapherotrites archaeon]
MLSKRAIRKIERAQDVYTKNFPKTNQVAISSGVSRVNKITDDPSYYANLRNTLYRRLAAYYAMPDIFYYLRIPQKKLGQSKNIIRSLVNSLADALEDFEEETKNLPSDDKIREWTNLKDELKSYTKETEKELRKIGINRKLGFVVDLFIKKMKEAKDQIKRELT